MRINAYRVIQLCVEHGVEFGWNRAHKHVSNPNAQTLKDAIEDAVLVEICEYFNFEEPRTT